MSGLPKNLSNQRDEIIAATETAPERGDFIWDGKDENDRPLSKAEMRNGMLNKGGRPRSPHPKRPVSIRLSPEVVEYFRSTGKGWQTRIDEVLREYVASHR